MNSAKHSAMLLGLFLLMAVPLRAEKWQVGVISFKGNDVYSDGELGRAIATKTSGIFTKVYYSPARVNADIMTIRLLYEQRGYLVAEARADITRDSTYNSVAVTFTINEGPQTLVDSFALSGISPYDSLTEIPALAEGEPFSQSAIDKDEQALMDALEGLGHLYARVGHEATVDSMRHRATVTITCHQGPLVFAGPIHITGLGKTREKVVRRELGFSPGDTLTSGRIRGSLRRLYATGLFNFVQIEPARDKLTEEVRLQDTIRPSVTVDCTEGDFLWVDASIGAGTIDYLRGGLETRYTNLFGLGHEVSFNGNFDWFKQRGEIKYTFPWTFKFPLQSEIGAYVEHHSRTYTGLFDGIFLAVGRETGRHLSYRTYFRWERIEYLDAPADTIGELSLPNTRSIGADVSYDSRSDLTDTVRGFYLLLRPEVAGLGGQRTNRYARGLIALRGYHSFFRWLKLSVAASAGRVVNTGPGDNPVPPQALYYLGLDGMRPLRGYSHGGYDVGGGSFVVAFTPLQVRFPLYKWLGGAFFVDGGFSADDPSALTFDDIRWVAGPGISIDTPVGQIQFDFGYRLHPERKWGALFINLGQGY